MDSAQKLLSAHLDGEGLSDEEHAVIDRWLAQGPAEVGLAANLVLVHEMIASELASSSDSPSARDILAVAASDAPRIQKQGGSEDVADRAQRWTRRSTSSRRLLTFPGRTWRWCAVAAGIIGVVLGGRLISNRDHSSFRVTELIDVQFADTSVMSLGREVRLGTVIKLTSGVMQMNCGEHKLLIAEGPVEFVVESDSSVFVEHGKILARNNAGSQFVVRTPLAKVIDLGTEFGVNVLSDKSAKVSVYDGSVALSLLDGGQRGPMRLVEGHRAIIGREGAVETTQFDPAADRSFVLPDEVIWRRQASVAGPPPSHARRRFKGDAVDGLIAVHSFVPGAGTQGSSWGFTRPVLRRRSLDSGGGTAASLNVASGGGLMVSPRQSVEFRVEPSREANFNGGSGAQGKFDAPGREIWLAWRSAHNSAQAPAAGLTLFKEEGQVTQEQLFVGVRPGTSTYVVSAPAAEGAEAIDHPLAYPLYKDNGGDLTSDGRVHLWIARLRFGVDGEPDSISLWCDGAWNNIEDTVPIAELAASDLSFSGIALQVDDESASVRFDFLVLTERFESILETLRAL